MTRYVEDLLTADVFRTLPSSVVAKLAQHVEPTEYAMGATVINAAHMPEASYVIKHGILGLFVRFEQGEMVPLDVLGPKRVIGFTALFARQYASPLVIVRSLMPSVLLRIPGAAVLSALAEQPETKAKLMEEMLSIMNRSFHNAVRVISSEQVAFPFNEQCPAGHQTTFLASANSRTGDIRGMCQRNFACSHEQGGGCPMSGKTALEFQAIASAA